MSRTISGTTTVGVTLTNSADNPVSVTLGALVSGPDAALLGSNSYSWTLANDGTLNGQTEGVYFEHGGTITNGSPTDSAALIESQPHDANAILIYDSPGNSSVTNYGTISGYFAVKFGTGPSAQSGDSYVISNSGLISGNVGIYLIQTNTSAFPFATITNSATITATDGAGVCSSGLHTSIDNSGTITGSANGVFLLGVGVTATASVGGTLVDSGTVTNGGSIGGGADGVEFDDLAASLMNTGTITAAVTSGSAYGVNLSQTRAGQTVVGTSQLVNEGYIGATGSLAKGLLANAGTTTISVTNANGATISGVTAGMILQSGLPGSTSTPGSVYALNQGRVEATGSSGVGAFMFLGAGTLANAAGATISGTKDGVYGMSSAGVTLVNAGTIVGGTDAVAFAKNYSGLLLMLPGAVFTGNVDGGNTIGSTVVSTLELGTGTSTGTLSGLGSKYIDFAQVTIDAGATWDFTGTNTIVSGATLTDSGTLQNNGVLLLDPSTMSAAALTGTGSMTIGTGSALTLAGTVASGQTIDMTGAGDRLNIGGKTAFNGTVTGFGGSGIIDLLGIGLAKSANGSGDALSLYAGTNHTGTKLFTFPSITNAGGSAVNVASLHLVDDRNGGTAIACYLRGTRIRTDRGEVPVEFLAVGSLVETLTGSLEPIRWIGRRRYVLSRTEGHAAVLPVLIRAGAIGDGLPRRDLCLSPEHALFIDGVLVPARHLTNGETIVRRRDLAVVEYFHLELAMHAVIFADGMPTETFVDCDSRTMFDNVASYTGGGAPAWGFCAPRVEEGEALEAIRQRINARAGIAYGSGLGSLIGNLERVTDESIEGWAQDASAPERPVWLEIIADGATAAFVLANRHRDDLAAAGLGSGRHAFRLRLPPYVRQHAVRSICVRRAEDCAPLPGSPTLIEVLVERESDDAGG